MFQSEYGAINAVLASLGLAKVSWFSSWATAFAANVTTNTWLGFPFMMVVALGALQSIPRTMYEAAEVDGASSWQRFWHITVPHLRPALLPAIALGSIWTFNMFNVIYLVSNGRPGGGTDILVTEAYRWAFERGERYGMAAAYATLIFLCLVSWTVVGARLGRNTLKGYFDGVPRELEEAARIDGASSWGVFVRIALPLARPGIAVTALFSFMTAWNEFILASVFMTDEASYTQPVLLKSFVGEYTAHWGLFAAGAVLTSIPVLALFYLLQAAPVGGLTAGSVKG
jgi:ABC-type sugar transport system permease subunit